MMMDQEQMKDKNQFMDCHSHLLDYTSNQDIDNVIKNALSEGVDKIVVNTINTQQFHSMHTLLKKYSKNIICGFGIHPCFLNIQQKIQQTKKIHVEDLNKHNNPISWVNDLEQTLNQNQSFTVGEIGLDFRKDILETNPKQLQMYYFKEQLDLAVRLQRPATIHCVRAYGEMLKIFKQLNKSIKSIHMPHLIMHSYGGSQQITKSMLKLTNLNIYFSFSLKRIGELCSVIPIQKLICQTDSPCQNNIELLEQQSCVGFNKYLLKTRNQIQSCQNIKSLQNQQKLAKISQILRTKQTNQPVNVIANIKSLVKYYGVEQKNFMKIIYNNSLRAFKLIR